MPASGLAREINQPLASIANYVEAARLALRKDTANWTFTALSAFDKIELPSERAVDFIRGLREYVDKRWAVSSSMWILSRFSRFSSTSSITRLKR